MVFFASKHRVKNLPMYKKLVMYPAAYILKYLAGGIIYLADKFDESVTVSLVNNAKLKEEM